MPTNPYPWHLELRLHCNTQGLDPKDCLTEVLQRIPHNANAEQAAALTPRQIAAERKASETRDAEQIA